MQRRSFLQGGAATLAVPVLGGTAATANPEASADSARASGGSDAHAGLCDLGAGDLQAELSAGRCTSVDVVQALLARADAIDQGGPRINAIAERNGRALAIARAMDVERHRHGPRGPLHGVPVLIKDNIDTGDDMLTTAGSLALAGRPALRDAALVQRLRDAGCVLLGKTNLSEWANFRGRHSTSGWSARAGLTRNPHALDRSPSGSSAGSAAAVAASLAPLAIGTETDGSIVSPSAMCGVVGFKPTLGRIRTRGIVPLAHSLDTAGPMARSVADAAGLFEVLADPPPPALGARLESARLKGLRLGVAREFFGLHAQADRRIDEALAALRREGATLVDPVQVLTDPEALGAAEYEVLLYEFRHDLDAYLRTRGASSRVGSLAELIDFNLAHAPQELAFFDQAHLLAAQAKGPLDEPAYREALATCRRLAGQDGIDRALARDRLDAIVAPTTSPAYPIDLVLGDHFLGSSSQPAAVAGYPHVTIPAGAVQGLPVGLSFFGAAGHDAELLAMAHAFERATRLRPVPRFAATAAAPR